MLKTRFNHTEADRYEWKGATSGEHTPVSRATDINGDVQPTLEELGNKKTFLEDNSQHPRTVRLT